VAHVKRRYAIAIERGARNYSAYVPDVDGCVATRKTLEETMQRIQAARAAHVAWMVRDGEAIPEPQTSFDYVEVEVPEPVASG
jgi:predicted RNase H-like HicB family nuclease